MLMVAKKLSTVHFSLQKECRALVTILIRIFEPFGKLGIPVGPELGPGGFSGRAGNAYINLNKLLIIAKTTAVALT
jgi:hypothetical protein